MFFVSHSFISLKENVTERVMAPVVWDADAENEEGDDNPVDADKAAAISNARRESVGNTDF